MVYSVALDNRYFFLVNPYQKIPGPEIGNNRWIDPVGQKVLDSIS